MTTVIYYGVKNLTRNEAERGVEYIKDHFNKDLFNKEFDNGSAILLNQKVPRSERKIVECFIFPPLTYNGIQYGTINTNGVQPHHEHIKQLLGGLEELFPNKFAATDRDSFNLGTLALRQELGLSD